MLDQLRPLIEEMAVGNPDMAGVLWGAMIAAHSRPDVPRRPVERIGRFGG